MQVVLIPWTCSAQWRMPVTSWREMMAHHYPGGGWIRLSDGTLAELARHKARRGLHSYDATVGQLLDEG